MTASRTRRRAADLEISRWRIVVPKLLATITVAAPFIVISAFVTSHVAFLADARATAAVTISALSSVALYSSVFVWLGLVTTQAIGIALLYVALWEGFFSGFVSGVRLLSIRYHSIALMHGLDERRFAFAADDVLGLGAAIVAVVIVFGGFLFLSIRRLRRMDVP